VRRTFGKDREFKLRTSGYTRKSVRTRARKSKTYTLSLLFVFSSFSSRGKKEDEGRLGVVSHHVWPDRARGASFRVIDRDFVFTVLANAFPKFGIIDPGTPNLHERMRTHSTICDKFSGRSAGRDHAAIKITRRTELKAPRGASGGGGGRGPAAPNEWMNPFG